MKIGNYTTHPAAEIFPMMSDEELHGLAEDIREHGLVEPLWRIRVNERWLVLDGRNRLKACLSLGVEVYWETFEGDDPVGFVVSRNLHRRHLNASQRGMVGGRIEEVYAAEARKRQEATRVKPGEQVPRQAKAKLPAPEDDAQGPRQARDDAAKAVNVSPRTVQDAKTVLAHGDAKLIAAVDAGLVPVSVAADVARQLDEEEQARVLQASRASRAAVTSALKDAVKAKAGQDASQAEPQPVPRLVVPDDLARRLLAMVPARAATPSAALRMVLERGLESLCLSETYA